ncbi:MAG: hypothetical protein R2834_01885 [Rhodothermales bacterium]
MIGILMALSWAGLLAHDAPTPSGCAIATDYYAIDLVSTKRVPGSGLARGTVRVGFDESPFGIAVAADGSYRLDLAIAIDNLKPATSGQYVAWVTTPEVDRIARIGPLDADHRLAGESHWNKFLVVITLEPEGAAGDTWQGPIVLRGLARSGMMHTMAGHGAFAREPCARYGY